MITFIEAVVRTINVGTLEKVDTVGSQVPIADCIGKVSGLLWAREVGMELGAIEGVVIYSAKTLSFDLTTPRIFAVRLLARWFHPLQVVIEAIMLHIKDRKEKNIRTYCIWMYSIGLRSHRGFSPSRPYMSW